jgi:hypothetical protein
MFDKLVRLASAVVFHPCNTNPATLLDVHCGGFLLIWKYLLIVGLSSQPLIEIFCICPSSKIRIFLILAVFCLVSVISSPRGGYYAIFLHRSHGRMLYRFALRGVLGSEEKLISNLPKLKLLLVRGGVAGISETLVIVSFISVVAYYI